MHSETNQIYTVQKAPRIMDVSVKSTSSIKTSDKHAAKGKHKLLQRGGKSLCSKHVPDHIVKKKESPLVPPLSGLFSRDRV